MEEAYKSGVEEMSDDCDDNDEYDDSAEGGDPMSAEMGTDEWLDPTGKEAAHPIEHDPSKDDPEAFRPSTMGDDEWISIGPGSFNDARDQVGKATK